MADFIDISAWQTVADLRAYKAFSPIVSLRATDGPGYQDPTFSPRWQLAADLGFDQRWAYHFARPGDPAGQAGVFLDRVHAAGGWRPGDVAMLDCEWFSIAALAKLITSDKPVTGHYRAGDPQYGVMSNAENVGHPQALINDRRALAWVGLPPQQALAFAHAWFAAVLADNPYVIPMIYGNAWYLEAAGITQADLPDVGWVVAAYGSGFDLAPGWSHACAWQFTDAARVPGLPAGVDCNRITCTTAPPFQHLLPITDGDLSVADISKLIDVVNGARDGIMKAVGARLDKQDKAIAEVSATVHTVGSILEYGDPDPKDGKSDPHYGFTKLRDDLAALREDVDAIKAKVGA